MADKNFLAKLFAGKTASPENSQKGLRLSLSVPVLTAVCLVLVCAVAWAFFMGFMVGRGQSPHAEIHAMTGMLEPQSQEKQKSADALEAAPPLQAPADLPQEPGLNADQMAPAPAAVPSQEQKKDIAPRQQPAAKENRQKRQKNTEANLAQEDKFAYIFQLAAFKSQREAENLQKKAAANGLKTAVRKSGKVYLVTTSLTGASADVTALRQKLAGMKLGKPLQLSKKPVPSKNSQKQPVKKPATRGDKR